MADKQKEIEKLFLEMGFAEVTINGTIFYKYGKTYYKISYIEDLNSFVIEYAETKNEAEKNLLEDGDLYSITLGEQQLLEQIKNDLLQFYMK